ncbi:MAG: aldehyde dehydrogenase family protein [Myxococcota bacterium]
MTDFAWLPIHPRGNYIDGAFVRPEPPDGVIVDRNPGDPRDVIGEFPYRVDAIEHAIAAARRAFRPWSDTPFEARAALLKAYAAELKSNAERLAAQASREMGKVLEPAPRSRP